MVLFTIIITIMDSDTGIMVLAVITDFMVTTTDTTEQVLEHHDPMLQHTIQLFQDRFLQELITERTSSQGTKPQQ